MAYWPKAPVVLGLGCESETITTRSGELINAKSECALKIPPKFFVATRWGDAEFRHAIQILRSFYDGYEGYEGYDLRSGDLTRDLSPSQKRRIHKHWNFLAEIKSGTAKRPYRPRSKKRIRSILQAQGYTGIPKDLRVAFVPVVSGHTSAIKYIKPKKMIGTDTATGREAVLIEVRAIVPVMGEITMTYIDIDPEFMFDDPVGAVQGAMSMVDADYFQFRAGSHVMYLSEYRIRPTDTPEQIAEKISKIHNRYSNATRWLCGLVAYKVKAANKRERREKYNDLLNEDRRYRLDVKRERELYKIRQYNMQEKIKMYRRGIDWWRRNLPGKLKRIESAGYDREQIASEKKDMVRFASKRIRYFTERLNHFTIKKERDTANMRAKGIIL